METLPRSKLINLSARPSSHGFVSLRKAIVSTAYCGKMTKNLQPTKFKWAINLNAAKALGITVPDSILVRADKLVQ
jgi:putative tryptophan/tyrosine transport system substrate-binding protein